MDIQFVDLKKQYASIKPEIDAAMQRVISNTAFILGKEVESFESQFAAYCNSKHCIGVSSGSEALKLALEAMGVGPGDEVISVPNTFVATIDAIHHNRARPVLVEVDKDTYNLDPSKLKKAITPKTKAILPVDLYGQPADYDAINEVAQQHGLFVLEDAAQSHGAEYKGRRTGSLAQAACFSYYPGKNLGAYGDGGSVVTGDAELADKLRLLRNYGQRVKYRHVLVGYNNRLDALQAAILSAKLKHLDDWNKARRLHAKQYAEQLSGVAEVETPAEPSGFQGVYHLYVIRCKSGTRDPLMQFLEKNGVHAGLHYPVPVHLQEAYAHLGYKRGAFPVTEDYAERILSLPMFPELAEQEITYVTDKVIEFYRSN